MALAVEQGPAKIHANASAEDREGLCRKKTFAEKNFKKIIFYDISYL